MVGADFGLVEVGEADAEAQQLGKALRRQALGRQANRIQGWPEGVAWIGVVGARLERDRAGRRATEDEVEARRQQVGDELLIPA